MSDAYAWTIGLRTVSLTNQREHWSKKASRAASERTIVRAHLGTRVQGLLPCSVQLVRVAPCKLDDDNLRGALKSVRDAVADALGVDDGDPRIQWLYGFAKGPYAVRIFVKPRRKSKTEKAQHGRTCQAK